MNTNHRDPTDKELTEARLTAYALDQLGQAERRAVEAELAASAGARQTVEEIRALAGHVREAARQDASFEPSAALRAAVEDRLSQLEPSPLAATQNPSPIKRPQRSRRRWIALAVAVCLLIAAIPIYFAAANMTRNAREVAMNEAGPRDREEPSTKALAPRKQRLEEVAQSEDSFSDALVRDKSTMRDDEAHYRELLARIEKARETIHRIKADPGVLKLQPSGEPMPGSGQVPDPKASPADAPIFYPTAKIWEQLAAQRPEEYGSGKYWRDYDEDYDDGDRYQASAGHEAGGRSDRDVTKSPVPGYTAQGNAPEAFGRKTESVEASKPVFVPHTVDAGPQPHPAGLGAPSSDSPSRRIVFSDPPGSATTTFGDGRQSSLPETVEPGYRPRMTPDGMGVGALAGVPGTEQYDAVVENPFLPVGKCPLSTFAIDVDTASYANVRRFLNEGRWPPPAAVRIEEMVNYFKYDYPPPDDEQPFSVHMEVAQCPWNGKHRLLRIGLQGREIDRDQRGPSNLVFLLDVSGSMSDQNKLPLVKQAMRMLVDQLGEDDRVAIVTYASSAAVQLQSTCGDSKRTILAAIESLTAGGSTHGSAGIQLAYQQAAYHFVEGGTNRVILATDGDLNVGITDDDQLVQLIQAQAKTGVFLTVLGFGTGNLKDSKLEKLADKGNGTYAYIDSFREAWKVLVEQLSGSLITIAKDVKVQIEFNPAEVQCYRLVGYENRILPARDFHDDRKDAGEIGAGHAVTALYELVPAHEEPELAGPAGPPLKYQQVRTKPSAELTKAARTGELLTLRLRYKQPDGDHSKLSEFTLKDSGKRFGEASPDFQFAAAVAAFGMVLRHSAYQGDLTLAAVEEFALSGLGNDSEGYRAEFVDLVRHANEIADP